MPTYPGIPFAIDLAELTDQEIEDYITHLRTKLEEAFPAEDNDQLGFIAAMYGIGVGNISTSMQGVMIEILRINNHLYTNMILNLNARVKVLEEQLKEDAEDIPWEDAI